MTRDCVVHGDVFVDLDKEDYFNPLVVYVLEDSVYREEPVKVAGALKDLTVEISVESDEYNSKTVANNADDDVNFDALKQKDSQDTISVLCVGTFKLSNMIIKHFDEFNINTNE